METEEGEGREPYAMGPPRKTLVRVGPPGKPLVPHRFRRGDRGDCAICPLPERNQTYHVSSDGP